MSTTSSSPLPAMHHNRLAVMSAVDLLLHVGPVLDVLPEIADVAADFLVGLEREGDQRDEAECEPLPALGDVSCGSWI